MKKRGKARKRTVSKKAKAKRRSGRSSSKVRLKGRRAAARKARRAVSGKSSKRAGRSRRVQKKVQHVRRLSRQKGEGITFQPLEQVSVACVNCGREFTVVKLRGISSEGMVCQRCSLGETQFPEA